ncbi:ABC transporter permease [Synechococcus sp. CBW1107]|uniref:ABC transporter permease n=1 Tax=Synechococcus sp. CBW1107 TaxID=2789857 RepID=UPI002AD4523C|nr:ABC transporter permease [Synechococcus sp. CBW1107]CAK6695991.1 Teichoic acid translocation permease protein TagG [Synechococcus sp. CBW1107]
MQLRFPGALLHHHQLLQRLVEREIAGRYRGSVLGWGWSLLTPLLMLAVYTFVFSQVFQARWVDLEEAGPLGFAINLFAGLIVFNLFSECVSQAPTLILNNANYVTKVIFPLDILGVVSVAAACFHAFTSLVILMIFQLLAQGAVPITLLWLPLVWIPLVGGCLALSWVLSALGVFLRDIGQVVGIVLNMMMFLSAVFYPLSALPERWQPILKINPLVVIIEQTRRVAVAGESPSAIYLLAGSAIALLFCELSHRAFQKARRGFADVL